MRKIALLLACAVGTLVPSCNKKNVTRAQQDEAGKAPESARPVQLEPSQEETVKQIAAWYNSTTTDFFGVKLSPTVAAELIDVKIIDRKPIDRTEVEFNCDMVFKMKATYAGGRDNTPLALLIDLGFENSPANVNEVKTLQAEFHFAKLDGSWRLQQYRKLTLGDNLLCGARVKRMSMAFNGAPEGELTAFECKDKSGKGAELELASNKLVDGKIETKQFGTFKMKSSGAKADYYMTESQIRKIKTVLLAAN